MHQRTKIPKTAEDAEELLQRVRDYAVKDADYLSGRTWSLVYWVSEEHHDLVEEAHNLTLAKNALNPIAFQGLRRMETEVVDMAADLFNGPASTVGSMTSGGTESLLLAVKTYRDRARKKWPWIVRPNLVAPATIHPAFMKASHLFGVKIKTVPVDEHGLFDVDRFARAINRNTIAIAASAPQYVTGAVDPIPLLGAIAQRKGLPFHVDACFGGFMQPWLERLGVTMPTWDFRVPGVTSLSADVHKYGYAPKGASVLLFRDMDHMRYQFFAAIDWPGGIYISPGLPGTRGGGPIAGAWASLQGLGEKGFLELAEKAWEVSQQLREGIAKIDGLRVLGPQPMSTIVTWASDDPAVDVYAVADELQKRGWGVDRQQNPASVHCTCNANNLQVVPQYLADLKEAAAYVRAHPELKKEGDAAVYGLMARVPVRGFVKNAVIDVMAKMYAPGVWAPPELEEEQGTLEKTAQKAFELIDKVRGA